MFWRLQLSLEGEITRSLTTYKYVVHELHFRDCLSSLKKNKYLWEDPIMSDSSPYNGEKLKWPPSADFFYSSTKSKMLPVFP